MSHILFLNTVSQFIIIDLKNARYNFAASLAGYSLVCYILQIKDRHNGNILIDRDGHMIHIDFDYFINNSPGNNFKFEKAPFKLTAEYIEILEGKDSQCFNYFKELMINGFMALQKEYKRIVILTAMTLGVNKNLPCFFDREKIISELNWRLFPQCSRKKKGIFMLSKEKTSQFIDQLH